MKNLNFIISAIIVLVLITPSYSSWLSYQNDPFHTGRTDVEGPFSPGLKWSYDCGYMIQTSPVINNEGTIFFGTFDISPLENMSNSMYAISSGGQPIWSLPFTDRIASTCSIDSSGKLYFGCDDGKFYCLNKNGNIQWIYSTDTDDSIRTSPVISNDGTIFLGTLENGLVFALNPDGTRKWTYETNGQGIQSSPCLSKDYGTVYFANYDGTLYALSTTNGGLKWSRSLGGAIQSSPAIGYLGAIVIGCNDYKLYNLDMVQGNLRWSYKTNGAIQSTPAISKSGEIYTTSMDGTLYSFMAGGDLNWTYSTGFQLSSSPIIDGAGKVYFGSTNKKIYALNYDGSFLWTYSTSRSIEYSSPAIDSNGVLYICSTDGKLYAIEQGLNHLRLPYTQISVKNKLTSFLMAANIGSSNVDINIALFDGNGKHMVNRAKSVQAGQLGIFNLQDFVPDLMGSGEISFYRGKIVLWSIIFNSEYGTGYPLSTSSKSFSSPINFPYWLTSPSDSINTFFMVNNVSSTSDLFLTINRFEGDGTAKIPISVNIPPSGMKLMAGKAEEDTESGYGYMEWTGAGSATPYGVVYNHKTNKGIPLDFESVYTSPVIVPFWQVVPASNSNALLYVVNPTANSIDADIVLYSFEGTMISSSELTIEPGKQQEITISQDEGQGWAELSWSGDNKLFACSMLVNEVNKTLIPISLNSIVNREAYIPFWQIYNQLHIDTYFVLTNFDVDSPASVELSFFNSTGQNLLTVNLDGFDYDPIAPGSTLFLSAKALFKTNYMGYAVIKSDEKNIALWTYAYNGQFDVGYTIAPQYPIGSDK